MYLYAMANKVNQHCTIQLSEAGFVTEMKQSFNKKKKKSVWEQ